MSAYIVFGDSISKGVVYDPEQKRYQVRESMFERLRQLKNLDIKVHAQFGATIQKGRQLLERFLPSIEPEDTVILEFGGNDCNFDWSAVSQDPAAPHVANTPLEEFTRIYREMIEQVHTRTHKIVLCTLPPLDSEKFFRFISANLNPQTLMQFLGEVQNIGRWQEAYSQAVQRIAGEFSLPVIPLRSAFRTEELSSMVCEDGMHPNEKGQEQMLSALLSWNL